MPASVAEHFALRIGHEQDLVDVAESAAIQKSPTLDTNALSFAGGQSAAWSLRVAVFFCCIKVERGRLHAQNDATRSIVQYIATVPMP